MGQCSDCTPRGPREPCPECQRTGGTGDPASVSPAGLNLQRLPPCTHLISVGYSSPVNRYTQMKELARQPLPSAA